MSTFVSILRGINVNGQKKILMAELKILFESLGFESVQTYIQSGNIVFNVPDIQKKEAIGNAIEATISKQYGFHVPTLIQTRVDLDKAVKKNPFIEREGIVLTKLHLTFLASSPTADNLQKLDNIDFSPDEFIIDGLNIYVYCPNGYGRTKLSNNFFESKLKVTATTRNWKTVNKLLDMCTLSA